MERCVCIHGHFYQPPRENPWLEDIELQDSAYPYHDWNERIAAECYEPNTVSRILSGDGWIEEIVNNYSGISFNFGPTLLSWMEKKEPEVYRSIIEADRESRRNFSGHGSALAQAYNHMIMPLASERDKYTQVIWGIRDFEHRFGRKPEAMWLAETAVDMKTLDIMAEHGIKFTILSPYQVWRVRRIGDGNWRDVRNGEVDTTMPYLVNLSESGRSINVFFYNGDISQAVAFEKLLSNGERFAGRLMGGFKGGDAPQLVHIATDGETYGHHHRHGDMALAYALQHIEANQLARITNYGEYLERHPPDHEAEIKDSTAWSCAHGVGRWKANCGCNTGMNRGWNQEWRAPLRNALDYLRDTVAPMFEERGRQFLKDPWAARNDYITVILERSPEGLERFLEQHAVRRLSPDERIIVLKLLEMQRHAMLMYTSCGWFFDEISGIETVQVIKYAARVIQLARELSGSSPESKFLELLAHAKSNIPQHRDGAHLYEKFVKPAMVDLLKVGAHYAICSLFEDYDERGHIYCYAVKREERHNRLAGRARLTVGRVRIISEITLESSDLTYGVINFGNHNVNCGVRPFQDQDSFRKTAEELVRAFDHADYNEVVRMLARHFEGATYSLRQLFRDKQRVILDSILDTTLNEYAEDYRRIYLRHIPLMRFLKELNIPRPKALHTAAEFILNTNLRQAFAADELDLGHIKALLEDVEVSSVKLDGESLGYVVEQTLGRMSESLRDRSRDQSLIGHLDEIIGLVQTLPFEVDLWKIQNIYYRLLQTIYPEIKEKAVKGDGEARGWLEKFNALGDKLYMRRNQ